MGFWNSLKNGGLGKSGGIKGLFEEIGEKVRKSDLSVRDVYQPSRILKRTGEKVVHKVRQKSEVIANNINSNFGTKVENFNDTAVKFSSNIKNVKEAINPFSYSIIKKEADLNIGDHIYVFRLGYSHHAIYMGSNKVIHYLREEGIRIDSIDTFAQEAVIQVKHSVCTHEPSEIVRRAFSRIGEREYDLVSNNCEHLANWCRNGR
ncbi:lecithin retinol acyltransferase family protein [Cohnella abietis]|uniref:LRAT domain-containing protein n=1 Tax=Cohnella abietis TaxID=2507935 RepID=A0A3T1D3V5_9BACL|nr:lecithin retinol acyltransferase family protein [Cohnella abietis]BBI32665.1 hypothetical protein KCTCHS21_20640 [Cohnella abietis]